MKKAVPSIPSRRQSCGSTTVGEESSKDSAGNGARRHRLGSSNTDPLKPSAVPITSTWRLPNGMSGLHISQKGTVPLPTNVGMIQVKSEPLGDKSGLFWIAGRFREPTVVIPTIRVGQPYMVLRVASLGGRDLCRPDGTFIQEEMPGCYSLNLIHEPEWEIRHQPGNFDSVIGIITLERLRAMVGGGNVSPPIRRFLDGHEDNYLSILRTSPSLFRLVSRFRDNPYGGTMASMFTQGMAYELVAEVFNGLSAEGGDRTKVVGSDRRRVGAACELLLNNLASPPSLEMLAREVGISIQRLERAFREITGMTVMEWLVDKKLQLAKEQIEDGDIPIKEISYRLGYAHVCTFAAAFSRKFGVPPARYRHSRSSSPFPPSPGISG